MMLTVRINKCINSLLSTKQLAWEQCFYCRRSQKSSVNMKTNRTWIPKPALQNQPDLGPLFFLSASWKQCLALCSSSRTCFAFCCLSQPMLTALVSSYGTLTCFLTGCFDLFPENTVMSVRGGHEDSI